MLWRDRGCELVIPLYPPYRDFNRDYSVFDGGGMAFREAGQGTGVSSASPANVVIFSLLSG